MTAPLMRGATAARQALASYLSIALPELLDVYRLEYDLLDWELPDPVRYDSYDPLTANEYPTVGSYARRTSGYKPVDITPNAEQVYETVYSMTAFLWVRTPQDPEGKFAYPHYDATLRLRDDLLSAVVSCLLTTPSWRSGGIVKMNESTLSTDYLDAIKSSDQSSVWLAGATISFDINVEERVHKEALASNEGVEIDPGLMK